MPSEVVIPLPGEILPDEKEAEKAPPAQPKPLDIGEAADLARLTAIHKYGNDRNVKTTLWMSAPNVLWGCAKNISQKPTAIRNFGNELA
ncbi:MAG: hypothetical protein ACP5E4_01530 [Candidatus Aenigmatarchaeota archaeon]